jgi:tRNA G10  N-methylase Trm11
MTNHTNKFLYSFNYDTNENDLIELESIYIFRTEIINKRLFTDVNIAPAHSVFIKNRLEIISFSCDYDSLIQEIKNAGICAEEFKVEYVIFDGDATKYASRLEKLRDVGYSIEGLHNYKNPSIIYGLCYLEGTWYFGELVKNNLEWHKHKQKPHSFSNSISVNIAKVLVNVAANSNTKSFLLDACCGVGTIMLEACFANKKIDGCDINRKTVNNARENLKHFNYSAEIYHSDVKDLKGKYDTAIIDLPYNLFTSASDSEIDQIISSTSNLTNRMVIVSTSDIEEVIHNTGFKVTNYCNVSKRGKTTFSRKIWVCERV